MNISFVLSVYNKLDLTTECYKRLRQLYPEAPLVISSGGSSDGTKEWLESLEDENLSFFHDDDRLTFSETYNAGIDLVDTEKIVLIHPRAIRGGRHQVTQIHTAFNTVIELEPQHVIAFGTQFHHGTPTGSATAVVVTPVSQAVGHGISPLRRIRPEA